MTDACCRIWKTVAFAAEDQPHWDRRRTIAVLAKSALLVCFLPFPPTLNDIIATHRDFWWRKRGWTHVKAKNPTQTSGSVPSKTRSNQVWNDITSNEGCIFTGGQWRASLASRQWGGRRKGWACRMLSVCDANTALPNINKRSGISRKCPAGSVWYSGIV